ncbi:hypothetical protein [Bacillus massiliigorillae]|uniref:hypothetical protein n=1 Tax=Bacillus massiliigorillae TaxID=1243664 RepID=UPI0003A2AD78|nr:hypothetical protein [Bacillus massiliigorillae]
MKKKLTIYLLILLFQLSIAEESKALTFNTLPISQSSKQWSVTIEKAEQVENLAKPPNGKFHTYSLKIDNIGEEVLSAEINIFGNKPNSSAKYALFGCQDERACTQGHFEETLALAKELIDGFPYTFSNFLLAEKSTELEVEIIWTLKEHEGKHLKESFIFSSKSQ